MRPGAFVSASCHLQDLGVFRGRPLQVCGTKRRRIDDLDKIHDHIEEALPELLFLLFPYIFAFVSSCSHPFMTYRFTLHDPGRRARARLASPERSSGISKCTSIPVAKQRDSQQRCLTLVAVDFYGSGLSREPHASTDRYPHDELAIPITHSTDPGVAVSPVLWSRGVPADGSNGKALGSGRAVRMACGEF